MSLIVSTDETSTITSFSQMMKNCCCCVLSLYLRMSGEAIMDRSRTSLMLLDSSLFEREKKNS